MVIRWTDKKLRVGGGFPGGVGWASWAAMV